MGDRKNEATDGRQLASGRYVLSSRLGGGGTADVYRAVDTLLDRAVAIKIFRPGSGLTDERRFEREARLLAPLDHPGLVTIHDAGVQDDRAYLVLQLVEGVTLRQRLARGRLTPAEATDLGARLATVLAYVHSKGIVHRDIKPSNVLLTGDGSIGAHSSIYLADFGISRLVDTSHLTATGLVVGTVAYMAPEQVRGLSVGPAADMFALGLVLLECMTGHTEYSGGNAEAAVARLSRRPHLPPEMPEPLRWVLGALTAPDPVARLTAEQCAAMLRDGGAGYGDATTSFLLSGAATPEPAAAEPAAEPAAAVELPQLPRKPSPRRRNAVVVPLNAATSPKPAPGSAVLGVPPPTPLAGAVSASAVSAAASPAAASPGAASLNGASSGAASLGGAVNGKAVPDDVIQPKAAATTAKPVADEQPAPSDAAAAEKHAPRATEPRVVPITGTPAAKRAKRTGDSGTNAENAPPPRLAGYSNDYPRVVPAPEPAADTQTGHDDGRNDFPLRRLLRRSWPWAAAGCLVLTIVLASSPDRDVRPTPQPYTINTPMPGVSPGAAALKPSAPAGRQQSPGSGAQGVNNVPIGSAGGSPSAGAPATPPPGRSGGGVVVQPGVGQPSPIPDPGPPSPPTEASPSPSPCPTKKNGNCKRSKPPKPILDEQQRVLQGP